MRHKYRIAAVAAAVFAMALALLAASPASAETAPAEQAAAPQIGEEVASGFERFVAEQVTEDGVSTSQQFECLWGWNVEVGGFYPEAWLRYATTLECSQIGPDIVGVLQGSLHDSPGGLTLHTGPDEAFAWCCSLVFPPAESGGEITLTQPDSFYINSDSIVDLLPEENGSLWLWAYLPEGCTGIGSPRAICDIDFESFDIT